MNYPNSIRKMFFGNIANYKKLYRKKLKNIYLGGWKIVSYFLEYLCKLKLFIFQNLVHHQPTVSKSKGDITMLNKLLCHGKKLRITVNPNPCGFSSHGVQPWTVKFTTPLPNLLSGLESLTCQKKMDVIAMRAIRRKWKVECGTAVLSRYQLIPINIVSWLWHLVHLT